MCIYKSPFYILSPFTFFLQKIKQLKGGVIIELAFFKLKRSKHVFLQSTFPQIGTIFCAKNEIFAAFLCKVISRHLIVFYF